MKILTSVISIFIIFGCAANQRAQQTSIKSGDIIDAGIGHNPVSQVAYPRSVAVTIRFDPKVTIMRLYDFSVPLVSAKKGGAFIAPTLEEGFRKQRQDATVKYLLDPKKRQNADPRLVKLWDVFSKRWPKLGYFGFAINERSELAVLLRLGAHVNWAQYDAELLQQIEVLWKIHLLKPQYGPILEDKRKV